MTFTLRFDPSEILALASRFDDAETDAAFEREVILPARNQGFLTAPQLVRLCEWKSPRIRPACASNEPALVEETTRIALAAQSERLRVGVLMLLQGVAYPMASVILHFVHEDPYPILDVRALWSVGVDALPRGGHTFELWQAYTAYTRELAQAAGVSMRVLDRAPWQYAYEHDGSAG